MLRHLSNVELRQRLVCLLTDHVKAMSYNKLNVQRAVQILILIISIWVNAFKRFISAGNGAIDVTSPVQRAFPRKDRLAKESKLGEDLNRPAAGVHVWHRGTPFTCSRGQ